jgi:sphingomyelin phosphodiesterase acid-like 3
MNEVGLQFRLIRVVLCCLVLLAAARATAAQTQRAAKTDAAATKATTTPQQVRALFVSDIHFEPFWDPSKTAQLAGAPVSAWKGILGGTAAGDREQRFDELQRTCGARGPDTSFALYQSSLKAMHQAVPDAKFITISGDLLAHKFHCKFARVLPQASTEEYQTFVSKTLEFTLDELHEALPSANVYTALGNNDSDCDDYKLDAHSEFLKRTGALVTEHFPDALQAGAQATFEVGGYYAVPLPAPLKHAELLVLDDLFMSRQYTTCGGANDSTAASEQLDWLREKLERARRQHESVWVMGHIPPGIDPYSTLRKFRNVCAGEAPEMFLASDDLPDLLAEFGDVVKLGIFGHTHMDEMRLLRGSETSSTHGDIALKLVASISPVNGNSPSFTVAAIDAATAQLADYQVFKSSNQTGLDASWKEEYDYAQAYKEPSYSAKTLDSLTKRLVADVPAIKAASEAYLRSYYVRDRSLELRLLWPQYSCALANYTAEGYASCRCVVPKR